jgi:hypothetical protein
VSSIICGFWQWTKGRSTNPNSSKWSASLAAARLRPSCSIKPRDLVLLWKMWEIAAGVVEANNKCEELSLLFCHERFELSSNDDVHYPL